MDRDEAIRLLSGGAEPGSPAWNAYYGPGGYYGQQKSVQDAVNDTFLQQPQVFNPILNPGYNSAVAGMGYNPGQYANNQTTDTLAALLGGTPYLQTYNDSPFNIPPMNMININGQLYNAGLLAKAFQNGDPNFVARMYGLTLNQPVLNSLQQQANYNAGVQNGTVPSPATNAVPPVNTPPANTPANASTNPVTPTNAASNFTPQVTNPTYPNALGNNAFYNIPGYSTNPTTKNLVNTIFSDQKDALGLNYGTPNTIAGSPQSTLSDVNRLNTIQKSSPYRTAPSVAPDFDLSPRSGSNRTDIGTTPGGRPNYGGYTRSGYNW